MSGIFNLAQMVMGRPDPQQQLLASLGGGPQPAGRPAAAGASAQPPVPGGAQGAPVPQNMQSTPDLQQQNQQLMDPGAIMRAMMQMQQRNRAEAMFTQGLGGLMSALSRSPSAAYHNQLLHQFDPQGQIDPMQMMQSYAAIQNFNMQQRQLQAFYAALPEASQSTGLTINELMGIGPEGLRQILLNQAGVGGPPEYQEFIRDRNSWARNNGLTLKGGVYKDAQGNTVPIPDQYSNFENWKTNLQAVQTEKTKQAQDLVADQHNFGAAKNAYDESISDLLTLRNAKGLENILGPTGQYATTGMPLADETKQALTRYNKILAGQYAAGVQDFHGAGRITQMELKQDLPSQSTMGNRNVSTEDMQNSIDAQVQKLRAKRALLFAYTNRLDSPDLSDADYSLLPPDLQKATNRPKPAEVSSTEEVDKLPPGRAFVVVSGPYKGTTGFSHGVTTGAFSPETI